MKQDLLPEAVMNLIKSGKPESQLARSIAAYLVNERKTGQLPKLLHSLENARTNQGIIEAEVISARKLGTEIKQEIKQLLEAKTVIMNEQVDESLLGGAVIRTGEKRLDLTLRGKLQKLNTGEL